MKEGGPKNVGKGSVGPLRNLLHRNLCFFCFVHSFSFFSFPLSTCFVEEKTSHPPWTRAWRHTGRREPDRQTDRHEDCDELLGMPLCNNQLVVEIPRPSPSKWQEMCHFVEIKTSWCT